LKLTLTNRDITTTAASTGGIEALQRLVAAFSRDLPPAILVVVQMNNS